MMKSKHWMKLLFVIAVALGVLGLHSPGIVFSAGGQNAEQMEFFEK